jgi:Na+/H+ antiporter NhaA
MKHYTQMTEVVEYLVLMVFGSYIVGINLDGSSCNMEFHTLNLKCILLLKSDFIIL